MTFDGINRRDKNLLEKNFKRKKIHDVAARLLRTYLDDILALSGGGCLTASAAVAYGCAAALAVSGVFLLACAVIVARAGRRR